MDYHWKNLETGGSGVSQFKPVQHSIFGEEGYVAQRSLDKAADDLINKWNAQQPKTWKYWRDHANA